MVDVRWVGVVRWWQSLISSLWPPQWIYTATSIDCHYCPKTHMEKRERCSSHRRPRTAKTHKGQIRDLQQRGETHDIGLEFALHGSSPLVGFFFSLNFDGGGGDGVAMYRW
jgi:hypothetical protein